MPRFLQFKRMYTANTAESMQNGNKVADDKIY